MVEEHWAEWPPHLTALLAGDFERPEDIDEIDDLNRLRAIDGIGQGRLQEIAAFLGREAELASPEPVQEEADPGIPWEEIVEFTATPEALAEELRRHHIFTADDIGQNLKAVVGAFQRVYGLDAGRLFKAARAYEERNKT